MYITPENRTTFSVSFPIIYNRSNKHSRLQKIWVDHRRNNYEEGLYNKNTVWEVSRSVERLADPPATFYLDLGEAKSA